MLNVPSVVTTVKQGHNQLLDLCSSTFCTIYNKDAKWYINYGLFMAYPMLSWFLGAEPVTAMGLSVLVGALIQGYDECGAQKIMNQYEKELGIAVGAVNGLLCYGMHMLTNSVVESCPDTLKPGAIVLSFGLMLAIMPNIMCFIESRSILLFGQNEHAKKEVEVWLHGPKASPAVGGCCHSHGK